MGKFSRETPMSEMDSQRALLDTLMGINRNNDREEDDIQDYRDKRFFHSEKLKEDFEFKSGDIYQYDDHVEREFLVYINEADRAIRKARQRLGDESKAAEELLPPPMIIDAHHPDLVRIGAQMDKVISEAEKSGEAGDIDTAMLLMQTVDTLVRARDDILNAGKKKEAEAAGSQDVNKKLRVCDICGSFLSVFDSDKRLADHFLGKQHLGYQKMREMVEAIKERRQSRRITSDRGGDDNRREEQRRDDDSRRRRSRSRSRSRGRKDSGSSRRPRSRSRDRKYSASSSSRSHREDDRRGSSRRSRSRDKYGGYR